MRRWQRRDRAALGAALLAPPALAAALTPFRADFSAPDAALVLVLVVVGVAATGSRLAGVLAALSAGVWFDFFLTVPYERFTIDRPSDVETTVLLLAVGVAVTELAGWGRRQQAEASRQAGYVAGIQEAADVVAAGTTPAAVIDQVCDQLTHVLGASRCRYDYGRGVVGGRPRLGSDGQVTWHGRVCPVERDGLPTDAEIELLPAGGAGYRGAFLLTATPQSRPSLAQRLVAVALADRAAAMLAEQRGGRT